MLLGLVSVKCSAPAAYPERSTSVHFAFTRRAFKLWKTRQSSFKICAACSEVDISFSIPRDESFYPFTFHLDSNEKEDVVLHLLVDHESRSVVAANAELDCQDVDNEHALLVTVLFQAAWGSDPFRDVPPEIMHMIFSSMIEAGDVDVERRGNSHLARYFQQIRLVNTYFAKTALPSLCRLLGTMDYLPRGKVFGTRRAQASKISPVSLFKRYPDASSPYLRELLIRDSTIEQPDATWSVLAEMFGVCNNLKMVVLFLKPPTWRKVRRLVLERLLALPRLTVLQITNVMDHENSRWDTVDLAFLMSRCFYVESLSISGWNLQGCADFSERQLLRKLRYLNVAACPINIQMLKSFLSCICRGIIPEQRKATFSLQYNNFWPDAVSPNEFMQLLNELRPHLFVLSLHIRPMSKSQEVMPTATAHLDSYFYSFYNLRELVIDGGSESSQVVSDRFLLGLSTHLPLLDYLDISWCAIQTETIPEFLARQEKCNPQREDKIHFCITPLFGDFSWTADKEN
ncbi:hypothetical protein BT69DRAFT_41657 [Atractiella rhizophila]|nr:hypothetical protein BT69DRAFT_41657 [Atractiella rhizophila]